MRIRRLRVLVCGGRDFTDRAAVYRDLDALSEVSSDYPLGRVFLSVIHGACPTGADAFAMDWACDRRADPWPFLADWTDITHPGAIVRRRADGTLYDAFAGPRRNARMLTEGKPEIFLAYPRADGRFGPGTSDMMRRLAAARVPRHLPVIEGRIDLAA